jgi:hypothetical protein
MNRMSKNIGNNELYQALKAKHEAKNSAFNKIKARFDNVKICYNKDMTMFFDTKSKRLWRLIEVDKLSYGSLSSLKWKTIDSKQDYERMVDILSACNFLKEKNMLVKILMEYKKEVI